MGNNEIKDDDYTKYYNYQYNFLKKIIYIFYNKL